MSRTIRKRVIWSVLISTVLLMLLRFALDRGTATPDGSTLVLAFVFIAIVVMLASLGALIVSRRDGNLIGWFFSGTALALSLNNVADAFATDYALAAWFANLVQGPATSAIVVLVFLLFPNGRPLTARWWPIVWSTVAAGATMAVVEGVQPGALRSYESVPNPLGIEPLRGVLQVTDWIAFSVWMFGLAAAAVSLVLRFRRSHGEERQQLKWFVSAAVVSAVLLLSGPLLWDRPIAWLWPVAFTLAGALVPASMGIAILRYRLYEIDLIIRRTLVYAVLTTGLGAVYWVGVVVLQQALRPFTQGSDLVIVGSTLAVAALFQPLRKRIKDTVDRRFYRQRYDAARTLESFSFRLRDEIDLDSLGGELLTVVHQTIQPQRVSLWLRPLERKP